MPVHGGPKLRKALNALPAKVRGRNLDEAVRLGASLVSERAKINAPYDTGRLRRSIDFKKNRQKSTTASSNYSVGYRKGRTRNDYTGAYYGGIVELKRPYLRPALESEKDNAADIMSKRIAQKMGIK